MIKYIITFCLLTSFANAFDRGAALDVNNSAEIDWPDATTSIFNPANTDYHMFLYTNYYIYDSKISHTLDMTVTKAGYVNLKATVYQPDKVWRKEVKAILDSLWTRKEFRDNGWTILHDGLVDKEPKRGNMYIWVAKWCETGERVKMRTNTHKAPFVFAKHPIRTQRDVKHKYCGDLPFEKSMPFYNKVLTLVKEKSLKTSVKIEFDANERILRRVKQSLGNMSLNTDLVKSGNKYIWEDDIPYSKWKRFHSDILAILRPHHLKIHICFEFKADVDTKTLVMQEMKKLNLNIKEK
jgi:hypothetical protein